MNNEKKVCIGLNLAVCYFNSFLPGWQAVVEPWRVDATLVYNDAQLGLRGMQFKGMGIIAQEILEVDLSEQLIKSLVHLFIKGTYILTTYNGNGIPAASCARIRFWGSVFENRDVAFGTHF